MEHITVTAPDNCVSGGKQQNTLKHMRHTRSGVCLAVLVLSTLGGQAFAGTWRATPHLEVLETYTDNVNVSPVNKQDDFVTRVSPGIGITGQGARISADIDYTANFLYFANSEDSSDLRHELQGRVNSELVRDLFYLDLKASINQQFVDRGGSLSNNFDNQTDNRKTVQNYIINPYLRRDYGSWGTANLYYRFNYIRSNANNTFNPLNPNVITNSDSHEFGAGFSSGRKFPRLRWGTNVSHQIRSRETGGNFERTTAIADASYPVNRWLSLLGSVGYEEIQDGSLSSQPDGLLWDVGVRLTPGPRTSLSLRGGERYGDENFSVNGSYIISPETRISIGYNETITTTQDVLANQLLNSDQAADPIVDPGGFSLIDSAFRTKRYNITLSGKRGRNTFSLTAFHEERFIDATAEQETNYGGQGSFSRQFGRHLSGTVSGNYRRQEFASQGNRRDDLYSGRASLNYRISTSLSGGVEYIRTDRRSTNPNFDLVENAVKVNLSATF